MGEAPLSEPGDLIGKKVTAVAFVHDCVEFHFDGLVLRSLVDPSVAVGEAVYRFPQPGSRDALCMVIGSTVQSLEVVDGQLEFTTSTGCRVRGPMARRGMV